MATNRIIRDVVFGEGHPDKPFTWPAPLAGTQHIRRLMRSGDVKGVKPGVLTVKGEWDTADVNLRKFEDPAQ